MLVTNYRDLDMWKKAMELCRLVYKLTLKFPKEERYGLTSQVRRSAVSVPSNIAEGFTRRAAGDKKYLLSVSSGSLAELETQIELAENFSYISVNDKNEVFEISSTAGKMITQFVKGCD